MTRPSPQLVKGDCRRDGERHQGAPFSARRGCCPLPPLQRISRSPSRMRTGSGTAAL